MSTSSGIPQLDTSRDRNVNTKAANGNVLIPRESLTLEDEVRQLRINYDFMVTYLQQQIHLKRVERAKLQQKLDQRTRNR